MRTESSIAATGTTITPDQLGKRNVRVNSRLSKHLLAYAAVAGAGLAACPQQAEAEVVYTPVISRVGVDYYIDLNHDGINDFKIHSSYISGFGDVQVAPLQVGNRVVVQRSCFDRGVCAADLAAGVVIGQHSPFHDSNRKFLADMNSFYSYGPWIHQNDGYLGFVFQIDGKEHFGWARIQFNSFFCFACIAGIRGFAYETNPGKAIVAGDTGQSDRDSLRPISLGMLALGAPGLQWRRREEE